MPFNAYAPMDLTKKLSSGKIELWWKRFLLQNTLENDFDFASQKLKPGHLNERKGVQCYTLVTVVVSSNSKHNESYTCVTVVMSPNNGQWFGWPLRVLQGSRTLQLTKTHTISASFGISKTKLEERESGLMVLPYHILPRNIMQFLYQIGITNTI